MRICLVEHHAALRDRLHDALDATGDIHVVGACASARQAAEEIPRLAPDAAVVGDGLVDGDYLRLCRQLTRALPGLPVILHVTNEDSCDAELAEIFGAAGYVVKQIRPTHLIATLRATVHDRVPNGSPGRT